MITIQDILAITFMAAFMTDAGLWLLFLLALWRSRPTRTLLRASLAAFVALVAILALDLAAPDWSRMQVADGLLIPVMFLLVTLNTFAAGALWFAISRLIPSKD